jgi:hypothetical protein
LYITTEGSCIGGHSAYLCQKSLEDDMHLTAWSSDEFGCAEAFLNAFPILLAKAIAQVAARRHRHNGTQHTSWSVGQDKPTSIACGKEKERKTVIFLYVSKFARVSPNSTLISDRKTQMITESEVETNS